MKQLKFFLKIIVVISIFTLNSRFVCGASTEEVWLTPRDKDVMLPRLKTADRAKIRIKKSRLGVVGVYQISFSFQESEDQTKIYHVLIKPSRHDTIDQRMGSNIIRLFSPEAPQMLLLNESEKSFFDSLLQRNPAYQRKTAEWIVREDKDMSDDQSMAEVLENDERDLVEIAAEIDNGELPFDLMWLEYQNGSSLAQLKMDDKIEAVLSTKNFRGICSIMAWDFLFLNYDRIKSSLIPGQIDPNSNLGNILISRSRKAVPIDQIIGVDEISGEAVSEVLESVEKCLKFYQLACEIEAEEFNNEKKCTEFFDSGNPVISLYTELTLEGLSSEDQEITVKFIKRGLAAMLQTFVLVLEKKHDVLQAIEQTILESEVEGSAEYDEIKERYEDFIDYFEELCTGLLENSIVQRKFKSLQPKSPGGLRKRKNNIE